MSVSVEFDDLEKDLAKFKKDLAIKTNKIKLLKDKIETARKNIDACSSYILECVNDLKLAKQEDIVELDKIKKIMASLYDSEDLIEQYKIEIANSVSLSTMISKDLLVISSNIEDTKKRLAEWGQLYVFKPRA